MTTVNQKEYLKKYLAIGSEPGKKKKRKKKSSAVSDRVKIIDDDIDVTFNQAVEEDLLAQNEDAPQVVGVIDDRPLELRIDDYRKSDLWKPLGPQSTSTETSNVIQNAINEIAAKSQQNKDKSKNKSEVTSTKYNDDYSPQRKKRSYSNDNSPPRKAKYSNSRGKADDASPVRRKSRKDSDETPPRRNREIDESPTRRNRKDSDSSPTKIRERDDDISSMRRSKRATDLSPSRKRNRDGDNSPARRSRKGNDLSPARRSRKDNYLNPAGTSKRNDDISPVRKSGKDDLSPARRSKRDDNVSRSDNNLSSARRSYDHHRSPIRRSRKDINPSPDRKSKRNDGISPTRRGKWDDDSSSVRRSKRDDHVSPVRRSRQDNDVSPARRSRREYGASPVRGSKKDDFSSPRRNNNEDYRDSRSKYRKYVSPRRTMENETRRQTTSRDIIKDDRKYKERNETWKSDEKYGKRNESPPRRPKEEKDASPRRQDTKVNRSEADGTSTKSSEKIVRKSRWNVEPQQNLEEIQIPITNTKWQNAGKSGLQRANELMQEHEFLRNATAIVRDRKTGKIRDIQKETEEAQKKQEKDDELKAKYDMWGKGLKQVEDATEKLNSDLHEMSKPLARYADDEDLERHLKEVEREGDPMLAYLRKKRKKTEIESGAPIKPQFEGDFLPNRYGIRPGHRWDGVDRSSGYETKWFEVMNSRRTQQEDAYKWSTEDM